MRNKNVLIIICFFLFPSQLALAHGGGDHHQHDLRRWIISGKRFPVAASFLTSKNDTVFLENQMGEILGYAISSFSEEDQVFIKKKVDRIRQLNNGAAMNAQPRSEKLTHTIPFAGISVIVTVISIFICLMFFQKKYMFISYASAGLSAVFFVFASCGGDDDPVQPGIPANDVNFLKGLFENFSGITTRTDDQYFYVSSNGLPDHNMMVGITSWQQQVPVYQDYTGDNSWAFPIQPVLADHPLSTGDHFLKGAIAIAVNGIPVFNPLNNRSEDTKQVGELDNWGGHCGKADDYHYHLPPLHLQASVGPDQPIAYALDGFPVYGVTTEPLDECLGRFNEDGSYQYHAVESFPYLIAAMKGKVTLDPATTAPEDQIIPQAMSKPVRGGDYGPLNGAVITDFTKTGTNAYSLEYALNNEKHTVSYTWDNSGMFTYTYVEPDGTSRTETYKRD